MCVVSYLYQQVQVPVIQQEDLAQAAFRHLQKETPSLRFGAPEAPEAPPLQGSGWGVAECGPVKPFESVPLVCLEPLFHLARSRAWLK